MKVTIEKVPWKKKFSVDCNDFIVEPCEDHMLTLTWSPTDPARCREVVLLKVDQTYRLQFIIIGQAVEPVKSKKVYMCMIHPLSLL